MEKTEEKKEEVKKTEDIVKNVETSSTSSDTPKVEKKAPQERNPRRMQGKRRRAQKREDRRPEFDSKIVKIRRVTRVVAGGRRFSFSVSLVAGDHKGRVGVGIGKASDTALAIDKAMRDAKKRMVEIPLTKDMRIPHETESKYCASVIMLVPTRGSGVAAGSSVRNVLELAGVKGVTGKILSRSKNQLNNARATVDALQKLNV
jgi:small subunit ribosomal protein S5